MNLRERNNHNERVCKTADFDIRPLNVLIEYCCTVKYLHATNKAYTLARRRRRCSQTKQQQTSEQNKTTYNTVCHPMCVLTDLSCLTCIVCVGPHV